MSDGNLVKARCIKETTPGVVPASAMQEVNLRSFDLKRAVNRKRPDMIRGDRRRFRDRLLAKHGTLTTPSYLQFNNLLLSRNAFMNNVPAATVTVTAATISFTAATKTIADTGNGLGSFAKGDIVFISGATNAGNNGAHGKVTTAAAGSLVVESTLTQEAAGASVTITTTRIYDGTTAQSLAWEAEYTDLTTTLRGSKGMVAGEWTLGWKNEDYVEESFTWIGQTPSTNAATYGTGAPTAAVDHDFMTSLDVDWIKFFEGGSASALRVSSFDFKGTNNIAIQRWIGNSAGALTVRQGSLDIDLDWNMYWDANAKAFQDKIDAETATGVWWAVTDPQGNWIAYSLPALSAEGDPAAIAPNQDNMAAAKLSAYYDDTWPYMFGVFTKAA